MAMLPLGSDRYVIFGDFGKAGIGLTGDDAEDFNAAVEAVGEYLKFMPAGAEPEDCFRVMHISFDVQTGGLESSREVTADVWDALSDRLEEAA